MDWASAATAALAIWTAYAEWRAKKRKREARELEKKNRQLELDLDRIREEAGTKAPWERKLYEDTRRAMDKLSLTKRK